MKLGFINFGGPTGQIAIMHDEIVERRRWITNGRFLHALNYCMLLPGPEAQQLAIYVGWLLHKVKGGLVAGIAFVLPSFFVMLALSWLYAAHGDVTWVSAILSGLAAAVIGIVASATIRIGKKALANGLMVGVAARRVRLDLRPARAVPGDRARRGRDRPGRRPGRARDVRRRGRA